MDEKELGQGEQSISISMELESELEVDLLRRELASAHRDLKKKAAELEEAVSLVELTRTELARVIELSRTYSDQVHSLVAGRRADTRRAGPLQSP